MHDRDGSLSANIVDIHNRQIHYANLTWRDGVITSIEILDHERPHAAYLLPGFVDAHVHIESSMLPPSEFARLALRQGVIGAVCDPHEIANVLGLDGIRYMVENGKQTPFLFWWGAPSCVPATGFETAGAVVNAADIRQLLAEKSCHFLSEVMNVPGVLLGDDELMNKLAYARDLEIPIDGHSPGLSGDALKHYVAAGISTDHECTTLAEAEEKLRQGMHILIREGSAARNFSALQSVLKSHPERVMFCSDDKHPDELYHEYINGHVRKALAAGHDLFDTLRAASLNPVRHYGLPLGLLKVGDRFDAQWVTSLQTLDVQQVWLAGQPVVVDGACCLPSHNVDCINRFSAKSVTPAQLRIAGHAGKVKVMGVIDGALLTRTEYYEMHADAGYLQTDSASDVLLIAVVNRYRPAPPALAFVHGFGFKNGAMASSVAHDSHNIVAVGSDEKHLANAINAVIDQQGGLAWVDNDGFQVLPLPIAGLMSPLPGEVVARRYAALDAQVKAAGSPLRAPFMTLSFLALLVIPALKLSDKGLFDSERFCFTSVQDA